jgi:hypothetical protein
MRAYRDKTIRTYVIYLNDMRAYRTEAIRAHIMRIYVRATC